MTRVITTSCPNLADLSVNTTSGYVTFRYSDPDNGLSGVREPRRPDPAPPVLTAALEAP